LSPPVEEDVLGADDAESLPPWDAPVAGALSEESLVEAVLVEDDGEDEEDEESPLLFPFRP
jgi:hypothetical protein